MCGVERTAGPGKPVLWYLRQPWPWHATKANKEEMAGEIKSTTGGVSVRIRKETVKNSSPSFLSSFMRQHLYSSPDGSSLPLYGAEVCVGVNQMRFYHCLVQSWCCSCFLQIGPPGGKSLLECSAVTIPHHTHQVSSPAVPVQSPASIWPWASPYNPICRHEVPHSGQDRLSAVVPRCYGSHVRVGELKVLGAFEPWWSSQPFPEFCPSEIAVSARSWGCLVMGTGRNVLEWRTRGPSIALAKGNQLLKLLVENLDVSLKRIFRTSAANSAMVVQRAGGKQKKKEPTTTFC